MNRFNVLVCCTFVLFLFSCTGRGNQGPPPSVAKQKAEYDALAKQMVQSVAYIGEPLKDLTDEQLASVTALLVMTRVAAQSEGIEAIASTSIAETFWTEVSKIYPPMPKVHSLLIGCLEEQIAYAACRAKGGTEEECGPEAAAEITCLMKQFEELKGFIWRIPGRQWPPRPFPWPVATGSE